MKKEKIDASKNKTSKKKTLIVFIFTILLGYILFIIPDLFFGITKINGGKIGINLFYIALFQLTSITALLYISLKLLNKDFSSIGFKEVPMEKDILLGLFFGVSWTVVQFAFLIPRTGGANRPDIIGMLNMYDGSLMGLLSFIALGVIGGGLTEELFNRGYFINVLKDVFNHSKLGLYFAAILSVIIFSLGHLPRSTIEWIDILIPTIIYTVLFIKTKRLTASIIAHGFYNLAAIVLVYFMYFK